jgi:hypothetical protein
MRKVILALVLLSLAPASLLAQMWHSPAFMPPRAGDELAGYVIEPELGEWGVIASWRQRGNLNMGVRGGIIDVGADKLNIPLGVEFYGPLFAGTSSLPLHVGWLLGAGATFGNGLTQTSIPLGISIGARLGNDAFALVPYATPRVSVDVISGGRESETDLGFTTDLGADIHLGNTMIVRVGGAVGDWESVGIGLVLNAGRRVAVR